MKTRLLLLFSLSLFIFGGCAQKTSSTKANFEMSMSIGALLGGAGNVNFPGGLMLYGSSGNKKFSRLVNGSNLSEELDNGLWDFYAIGWDDSSTLDGRQAVGKAYCAKISGVNLDGADVAINLDLSNINCSNSEYGATFDGVSNEYRFLHDSASGVTLFTCNQDGMSGVTTFATSECAYRPDADTNYVNTRGFAQSYRLTIPVFDNDIVIQNAFESSCVPVAQISSVTAYAYAAQTQGLALNFPFGDGANTPFRVDIEAYASNDCSGLPKIVSLENGLNAQSAAVKTLTMAYELHVFVPYTDEDICAMPERASGFPYGDGTTLFPYAICTPEQMLRAGTASASNSYILASDIDMNPVTDALLDINGLPRNDCVEEGSNFIPLGSSCSNNSSVGDPSDDTLAPGSYTGTFNGNNYTLSSPRYQDDTIGTIGLAATLGSGGKIMHLTIEDAEFEGSSNVGTFAGAVASGGVIYKVEAYDSYLMATDHVGGIVGTNDGSISYASVFESEIEGVSYIGGLIGLNGSAGIYVYGVFRDGMIFAENDGGTNPSNVGGLVGNNMNSTSTDLDYLGFRGAVISVANSIVTNVGDLSGSGLAPVNSYADGVVMEFEGSSITITPSYSASSSYVSSQYGGYLYYAPGVEDANNLECLDVFDGTDLMTVAEQVSAGKGTSAQNPILLCETNHVMNMVSNKYYKMGSSINMDSNATVNLALSNIHIDGNGKILFNLEDQLFASLDANSSISDLAFIGHDISAAGIEKGLITNSNSGVLSHIFSWGRILNSTDNYGVGGLVYTNAAQGVISDSEVAGAVGGVEVGGVAYENFGSIDATSVEARIIGYGGAVIAKIGGVAAYNDASISMSRFTGEMQAAAAYSGAEVYLGAIAGHNDANGSLLQVEFSRYGRISYMAAPTAGTFYLGTLVGRNEGDIQQALSVGYLDSNSGSSSYADFAGSNTGTISQSFGDQHAFLVQGSNLTTNGCSSTDVNILNSTGGSITFASNNAFRLYDQSSHYFVSNQVMSAANSWTLASAVSDYFTLTDDCDTGDISTVSGTNLDAEYRASVCTYASPTDYCQNFNDLVTSSLYTNVGWDVAVNDNDPRIIDYHITYLSGGDLSETNPPVWVQTGPGETPQLFILETR